MKIRSNPFSVAFIILSALVAAPFAANAQLVTDGATASISGISTNLTGNLTVGNVGSFTTLIITNSAAVTNSGNGVIGNTGRTNQVIVTDTNSIWVAGANLQVGNLGRVNRLTITNGGSVKSLQGTVGNGPSSFGNLATVTGPGSSWTATVAFAIGSVGSTNGLVITNGGRATALVSQIASTADSHDNFVTVTDAGSIWANIQTLVGAAGSNNTLTIINGGVVTNTTGSIGTASGSVNNRVLVTGANSAWTNGADLFVGEQGPAGQLIVSNLASVVASNLVVGLGATSLSNSLNLSGGTLIVTNASGAGGVDIRRGSLSLNSGLLLADRVFLTNGAPGQFVFSGGLLQSRSITSSNGLSFLVGDGVAQATYELFGDGTNTFDNGLQIASNALLKGVGTIIGNVTNGSGGMLSPGASIGRLVINGGLVLGVGSSSVFEVNKTTATNDAITGLTGVTYGGTLIVTNLDGALTNGDTFKLFSAASYGGTFNGVAGPSPGAGLKWNMNRLPVDGVLRVVVSPNVPPVINNPGLLNGTSLVFGASGGVPYDPVYLLTSIDVTLPLSNWAIAATNYFDAGGAISFTNAVALDQPQKFFSLRVD